MTTKATNLETKATPEITRAAERYLEQYGDPLVMNTYLKVTVLVLAGACIALAVLTFKSQQALANMHPMIVRINDVGHAEAIDYRNFQYRPQEAENKYYLILGATEDLESGEAKRLLAHPLPHWVERMTVSYLRANGGRADRENQGWNLIWPNGENDANVVFTAKEAEQIPASRHLTLEEPKIRGLAMRLPRFAPGQPIPIASIPGLSEEVHGIWSLWRIAIASMEWNRRSIMPLFLADNGMILMPTARHVWDQLLVSNTLAHSTLDNTISQGLFTKLQSAAEEHGRPIYDGLVQEHRERIARERQRADYAFTARRKTVRRIGLPEVRSYRLNVLAQEERAFQEQLELKARTYPEMVPLLVMRIDGGGHE
ncbi:MAG: hypothetical protein WA899_18595 [Candidatus Sulfotelmatobacter sp.]